MYKTILEYTIIIACLCILIINTSNKLTEIDNKIGKLQTPRYITSEEPHRIAATLLKTYPYLKVWGPDVLYYWSGIIYDQCQKRDLDWAIVCAKIHCESGFDPKAISSMDAKGISQVLDSTAVMMGKKIGITYVPGVTLWNDVSCMLLGIAYLDQEIKREGSVEKGLKSYNGGPGWRKSPNQKGIHQYATKVIGEAGSLKENYRQLYPKR